MQEKNALGDHPPTTTLRALQGIAQSLSWKTIADRARTLLRRPPARTASRPVGVYPSPLLGGKTALPAVWMKATQAHGERTEVVGVRHSQKRCDSELAMCESCGEIADLLCRFNADGQRRSCVGNVFQGGQTYSQPRPGMQDTLRPCTESADSQLPAAGAYLGASGPAARRVA